MNLTLALMGTRNVARSLPRPAASKQRLHRPSPVYVPGGGVMKFQRIRYCDQCEELLPKVCTKCVKHPDRRPRMVELFGMPPVLSIGPCGCVKIGCQRTGCAITVWRVPRADGSLGLKNQFCSKSCNALVTAERKKAKRITATCSDGCGRTVTRPASNMRAKYVYFSQVCHFKHRTVLAAEKRIAAAQANKDTDRGLLECLKCKDIKEHLTPEARQAICLTCGTKRDQRITATTASETLSIRAVFESQKKGAL